MTGDGPAEPQDFEPQALIAALRRKAMPPARQAEAYQRLLAWAGSIDHLSIEMGLTPETVRQRLLIFADPVLGPAFFTSSRLSLIWSLRVSRAPSRTHVVTDPMYNVADAITAIRPDNASATAAMRTSCGRSGRSGDRGGRRRRTPRPWRGRRRGRPRASPPPGR